MSTTTYTFSVEGMHCGSCALLIDDALEDLAGVVNTETSVKDGRSVVEVDPNACTSDSIIATITEVGYTAQHA